MIELFDGILRFNIWLFIIDVGLIIWFVSSWYSQYKKTGRNVDYWRYYMFLYFFVPVLVMYPFVSSPLNVFAVGDTNVPIIEDHANEAFIITLIGFLGVYIGKYLYDNNRPVYVINLMIFPFAMSLGKWFAIVTKNSIISRATSFVFIVILSFFLSFIIVEGLLRNPREFFMINSQYRPIYNFIIAAFSVVVTILSTRVLQYNNFLDKLLFFITLSFGFFLGVRGPIFYQLLGFGLLYIVCKKGGYIPFAKLTLALFAVMFLAIVFSLIRNNSTEAYNAQGQSSLLFLFEIFYGNNFSDTRDFSWVLGYWDRGYYYGMSYFSAFLSFIPSSIFPFRQTWGIGKLTVNMIGFDPETHPGLRPGMFGEMYLNFGVVGVLLFGILWGYVIRHVSSLTKKCAEVGDIVKVSSIVLYSSFVFYLTSSAGFFNLYVHIILLAILFSATKIRLRY